MNHKFVVIASVTILFAVSMALYPLLGTQLFPETDAGTFTINFRAPAGTRLELTTQMARQIEGIIRQVIPPGDLDTVVSNIGLAPSLSAIYSSNSSEDSGFIQVELKNGHARPTAYYVRRLRAELPQKLPEARTLFSSGSIIDAVLNFGMMAPIDVQFAGREFDTLYRAANQSQELIRGLPEVAQTFVLQEPDYPTFNISVDRVKAARLGLSQKDVVTDVITALNSNLYIAPSVWIDRKNSDDYFLTVQYKQSANGFDSMETLRDIPVHSFAGETGHAQSLLLRDVAAIAPEYHPSEADHYNIQRVVDLLVAPSTQNLGGTQAAIEQGDRWHATAARGNCALSRIGGRHACLVLKFRIRTVVGGDAAVPCDGRSIPVVSRSLHYHVCRTDGVNRRDLDAVGNEYHTEYRVVHGNNSYGGNRGVEFDSSSRFCQSKAARRRGIAAGGD